MVNLNIIKKGINIFFKKGFLRGAPNLFFARVNARKVPPLNKCSRTPLLPLYSTLTGKISSES